MSKRTIIRGGLPLILMIGLMLSSCQTIPEGVEAVANFDKQNYLGKWYEIARFDHRFESGLSNVTAEYTLHEDGTIKVVNRGYDEEEGEFKEAVGKAKFVGADDVGQLKVSFFGPFYSGYNVIAIDPDYQYALVVGKSRDYLWLLARNTSIPEEVKEAYLKKAAKEGYDLSKLIWVAQNR